MTGNKGEWSELYVLLKLLAEGKLYAGDENVNKIESIYYDILKVIKKQREDNLTFIRNGSVKIFSQLQQAVIAEIPISEFMEKAQFLFNKIKNEGKGAFSVPELELFTDRIKCTSLKGSSNNKTDIMLVVHDAVTGSDPLLGFSIKSRLGSSSTLLNASLATNFVYKVIGKNLSEIQVNDFNNEEKFKNKFAMLDLIGARLGFCGVDSPAFAANLMLVDTKMPLIVGNMLENYYRGKAKNVSELARYCAEENCCRVSENSKVLFYSYKIKEFLTNVALGMMPATYWDGKYEATGGYIIVKEDGDILCYHIYNRNDFRDYLYKNTKFETASTGRNRFGTIYTVNNEQFLKLNLQIRFLH